MYSYKLYKPSSAHTQAQACSLDVREPVRFKTGSVELLLMFTDQCLYVNKKPKFNLFAYKVSMSLWKF